MFDFENRITTKKGSFGEEVVDRMLREKGFVIYKPENGRAHAFDRLAIKDKEVMLVAEVKSKAKRKYYPDTGIDYRHYIDYKKIMNKYNMDVVLFFVDEEERRIYGGRLSLLEKIGNHKVNGKETTYPKVEKGVIYFHLDRMTTYSAIDQDDANTLMRLTSKKSFYQSV